MEDKLETRYYKLERLCKWEHVDKVNEMLLGGISPHEVSAWCKENGFSISHPKLYEYKEILATAVTQEVTVERLLGIGVPKRTPIILASLGLSNNLKNRVRNEMEVLDHIIHLAATALAQNPVIKIESALKAIELKNKITEGKHAGLTNYGLDQLRELEKAKFDAIVGVVMRYLPEETHQELTEEIAKAERAFYEERAPELLEQYEEALRQAAEDNEDFVVSDTKF